MQPPRIGSTRQAIVKSPTTQQLRAALAKLNAQKFVDHFARAAIVRELVRRAA